VVDDEETQADSTASLKETDDGVFMIVDLTAQPDKTTAAEIIGKEADSPSIADYFR